MRTYYFALVLTLNEMKSAVYTTHFVLVRAHPLVRNQVVTWLIRSQIAKSGEVMRMRGKAILGPEEKPSVAEVG